MIDQATADKIYNAADIVEVVSEFVTLRRSGANYKGLCPFHNEKTPSFMVSPSKGICKCFSCGKGGNVVHFLMELEQYTYPEALRWLAKKYNIEIQEKELTDEEKLVQNERESLFAVNNWACQYFQDILENDVNGRAIGMAYFRSRGIRDDIIKKFKLGFSLNSFDALTKKALAAGYDKKYLLGTSICKQKDDGTLYDTFRGRVIFPWLSASGNVVAFGGRVLDAATKGVNQKYVNSSESVIFHKGNELYGIYQAKQAISKEKMVYMVEGYTDVISMHQCGIENVVANSGTALSMTQVRMLHRLTQDITLLYDGDAAGLKAATRGTDMFLSEGMNVKVLFLPDGDDPDSFAKKHTATEFKEYIEANQTDFIKFKTSLLMKDAENDPLKKANVINDIVATISVIPEGVTRSVYTTECSQLLQINEQVLIEAVNKARIKMREEKEKQKRIDIARKEREANASNNTIVGSSTGTNAASTTPTSTNTANANASQLDNPSDIPIEAFLPPEAYNTAAPNASNASATSTPFVNMFDNKTDDAKEQLIIKCIVRYGEKTVFTTDDENGNERNISVIEFVNIEMTRDGLKFSNPLYKKMLDLGVEHLHDEGFAASKFYSFYNDQEISMLAANLLSDRYQLSKYHSKGQTVVADEDVLYEILPHIMNDFKYSFIKNSIDDLRQMLKVATMQKDTARIFDLMKQLQELNKIQNLLAKELGDRTVKC